MPLTEKGKKILKEMKEEYGDKIGERVFYASQNKGSIKGVEKKRKKHGDDKKKKKKKKKEK